jgi:hypothetical protein
VCSSDLALDYDYPSSSFEDFESLRNKHAGETVFIVGNGPSLKITDPRKIRNSVVMGCNGICKLEIFDPNYYFVVDAVAIEQWGEDIDRLNSVKFFPTHLRGWAADFSNSIFYSRSYDLFSKNVDPYFYGLPKGLSVISPMIYMSIFMGFKRMIFIGVDQFYGTNQSDRHFIESYYNYKVTSSRELILERLNKQKVGISLALSTARSHGVELFDAGPCGNLGIESINFEDVVLFNG